MEFDISDLMDGYVDESVSIRPCTQASRERIKELTMKKVHKYEKPRKKGLSFVTKMLVAAIIIATLAIPVMATDFQLIDWLEGLNKPDHAEWQAHYESWENTEGFWQVGMTVRDLNREGMVLAVREAQDSPVTGNLQIHGDYWLEHWNGEAFEKTTASAEIPAGETREIKDGDELEIPVNWAEAYGALESGRYRLGKTFTYTYSDGKTVNLTEWAEFRIFNEDMTPYIEQCKAAMDALLERDSYHLKEESYGYEWNYDVPGKPMPVGEPVEIFGREVWKSGEDSLVMRTVAAEEEDRHGAWGELLLADGQAFAINRWKDNDIRAGVEDWQYDNLLSEELNSVEYWHFGFAIPDSQVGEIWVEGNTVGILSTTYPSENNTQHEEQLFFFREDGTLAGSEKYLLPELHCAEEDKVLTGKLTVFDTPAGDVRAVLDAQNVGEPVTFSWAEEKQLYTAGMAGVKTSGFSNTRPVEISNAYEAYMHAFADYEVVADTHHASEVSYDAETGMWKVEFWWANGNVDAIIYMDARGMTVLTVMGPYTGE